LKTANRRTVIDLWAYTLNERVYFTLVEHEYLTISQTGIKVNRIIQVIATTPNWMRTFIA